MIKKKSYEMHRILLEQRQRVNDYNLPLPNPQPIKVPAFMKLHHKVYRYRFLTVYEQLNKDILIYNIIMLYL